ncbi:unnamed protein product [Mytilus coruscus]|uniref:MAM domain-containing protein n=1 Tax=Mytilus coruscus TaxID=42192 RepID=A0A6J8DRF2_MYTCO|nr:unnamed protein product [Mytilus coruscus]
MSNISLPLSLISYCRIGNDDTNIDVIEEETPCRDKPCVLNSQDTQTIEDNCNGESSCLVDYNFTSTCLRELRYTNLSYTCKHENGTSISTFEDNFGDWMNVSSNSFTWDRTKYLLDHTQVTLGSPGYSMTVFSYRGTASTQHIATNNEFMEPICLSLWYQIYQNGYDCSFSIYKIYDGNRALLFTADCNSTSVNQWIKISVDVYGKGPFKVVLEADFKHRDSAGVRAILVDDTSIAYRPCQGQPMDTTCLDMNRPITIECETQFLAGDINLSLKPKYLIRQQKNCSENPIASELNTFCRNFYKSDQCKFNMLDFINGYDDCYDFSKYITVMYQCSDIATGSTELSTQYYNIDITEGSEGTSVESIQFDINSNILPIFFISLIKFDEYCTYECCLRDLRLKV